MPAPRDASRREVLPALPQTVRDYIGGFNITAIVIYRDGRVGTSRDPVGAAAAWWVGRRIGSAGTEERR
jgi:hypothetical protein